MLNQIGEVENAKGENIEGCMQQPVQTYNDLILNVISSFGITCTHCNKVLNLSSFIFICPSCTQNNIYCFTCLITLKHPHDYIINPPITCCPVSSDWSVVNELQLLSYIEKNGLDNWLPLSNSSLNKGIIDINQHYLTFYSEPSTQVPCELFRKNNNKRNKIKKNAIQLQVSKFLSGNNTVKKEKVKEKNKDLLQKFNYSHKRNEFEIEYLNEIEIELIGLEFNGNEDNFTLEEKYTILKYYNSILDIREQLKDRMIHESLFGDKYSIHTLDSHELQIIETFLPLINNLPLQKQIEFIDGKLIERKLRLRLKYLENESN